MAKRSKEVDKYIQKQDPDFQPILKSLREFIFRVLPQAKESMYYKMPTYHVGEKICAFAAQKHHLAVYIMQDELVEKYAEDFAHLDIGKSCIRFTDYDDFPLEAFENILLESVEPVV